MHVQFITCLNTFVHLWASPERALIGKSAYEAELRVKTYIEISRDVEILSWHAMVTVLPQGASLPLVGHPSSDGVTIKMSYGVDVLHRPALHPIFS